MPNNQEQLQQAKQEITMPPMIQKRMVPHFTALIISSSIIAAPALAAPQINPDSYRASPGQSITFNPVENDSGNNLVIEALDAPPYQGRSTGTNSFSGNQVTYNAPADFTGTTTFYYGVRDGDGDIASAPITVNVNVVSVVTETNPGLTTSVTTTGGADDRTSSSDTAVGVLEGEPRRERPGLNFDFGGEEPSDSNGTVQAPPNLQFPGQLDRPGGFLVSPALNLPGIWAPAEAWPVAGDDTATTDAGKTAYINPLWNDTQGVYIKEVNDWSERGSKIHIENGQLVFKPGDGLTGKDTFWYVIADSRDRTAAAKVTVSIAGQAESPYPIAKEDHYTVRRNSRDNVFKVFDNDSGEGLYFTRDGLFTWTKKGGQSFPGSWDVVYNAPYNFVGTDSFWYTFEDSIGRTNAAKVTVDVTH